VDPPPPRCRPPHPHPPPPLAPPLRRLPPSLTQAKLHAKQAELQADISQLVAARPGDPSVATRLGAPPPPPAAAAPGEAPEAALAARLDAVSSNIAQQLNARAMFDWEPQIDVAAAAEAFAQSWPFWPDMADGARAAVRAEWERRQQQQQQPQRRPQPPARPLLQQQSAAHQLPQPQPRRFPFDF
jgi:hypothetical protein